MIAQTSIDRIRDLSIKDVVEKFLPVGCELKKNGTGYKCKSPFNNENTPSFYVVPAKNIFKDFSSGHGGDAIRFVMLYEKCTFIEAIEKIAAATGERLEYDRPATDEEKQQYERKTILQEINTRVAAAYAKQLLQVNNLVSRAHLFTQPTARRLATLVLHKYGLLDAHRELTLKRKFTLSTLLQWQIGLAPDGWKFLTKTFIEKAKVAEGMELGLIREKDHRHYDFFRNRVMYPIFNERGAVVSFGGRTLGDGDEAKYMNGTESPIYVKNKTLYGLNFAGKAIHKHGYAYLMEGYTDVISFHQAGYNVAVGVCGTGLTPEQCTLLKSYTDNVVIFPDYDPNVSGAKGEVKTPGEDAALNQINLLMQHGFSVHVVPLGEAINPLHAPRKLFDLKGKVSDLTSRFLRMPEGGSAPHVTKDGQPVSASPSKIDPDELVRMLEPVIEIN